VTFPEFYDALAACHERFVWCPLTEYDPEIRGTDATMVWMLRECCPITAVAYAVTGTYYEPFDVPKAAQLLGLSASDEMQIVLAADCGEPDGDLREREPLLMPLRTRLMECVGLQEESRV
jgi:hypothetical protein